MVGAVVRSYIAAGEPITDGAVVKPGDRGFLAAVLNPGMRAVSVPINADLEQRRPDLPGRPGRSDPDPDPDLRRRRRRARAGSARPCSKTSGSSPWAPTLSDDAEPGKANERAKTATFEVTPQQAESVALLDRARQALAEPAQPGVRSGGGERHPDQRRQQPDLGQGRLPRPQDRPGVVATARAARQQHRRRPGPAGIKVMSFAHICRGRRAILSSAAPLRGLGLGAGPGRSACWRPRPAQAPLRAPLRAPRRRSRPKARSRSSCTRAA